MSQSIRQQASVESDWKNILWREWRNSEDEEYAHNLFKALAKVPKGWWATILVTIFDLMAYDWRVKWHGYDPTIYAPFIIGVVFGLVAALITVPILGWAGVVMGLVIGSLTFLSSMTLLMIWPGLRQRMTLFFDRLQKRAEPDLAEVEWALHHITTHAPGAIWTEALHRLNEQKQCPVSPDKLVTDLQSNDWLARFVARHSLVALGGETVEVVSQIIERHRGTPLGRMGVRILKNVELETSRRLAEQTPRLLCSLCFVRCQAHRVSLSWQPDFTFYGCRACGQSREFITWPGLVVVVLDAKWTETQEQQADEFRLHWFRYSKLFDFDRVEIIQASDEEVERFAVQVGNDTDPVRKPRYREMICTIGSDCQLSENTLRILGRMFGKVEHQMGVVRESNGS